MKIKILGMDSKNSDYIQIRTIESIPDKFGRHLAIKRVGLYDKNGKWKRWVKLNDALLNKLHNAKIYLD